MFEHPHHSVEDRTSLHFLTLQNGHFLGKRERLSGQTWKIGPNSGTLETKERARHPVFAGFLAYSAHKNRETGLVGWGARIRTWECRNQNPVPYHLATPQRIAAMNADRITAAALPINEGR
jgi:hypothetical protein